MRANGIHRQRSTHSDVKKGSSPAVSWPRPHRGSRIRFMKGAQNVSPAAPALHSNAGEGRGYRMAQRAGASIDAARHALEHGATLEPDGGSHRLEQRRVECGGRGDDLTHVQQTGCHDVECVRMECASRTAAGGAAHTRPHRRARSHLAHTHNYIDVHTVTDAHTHNYIDAHAVTSIHTAALSHASGRCSAHTATRTHTQIRRCRHDHTGTNATTPRHARLHGRIRSYTDAYTTTRTRTRPHRRTESRSYTHARAATPTHA
jgi:hypothetical protein